MVSEALAGVKAGGLDGKVAGATLEVLDLKGQKKSEKRKESELKNKKAVHQHSTSPTF